MMLCLAHVAAELGTDMLFLVEGSLTKTPYMGKSREESVLRLVDASTEEAAIEVFTKFYEKQSDPYGTHVSVNCVQISPVLTE